VNTLLRVFWGKKLNVKELMWELNRSCEENIIENQGLINEASLCATKYFFLSFKKESKNDARDQGVQNFDAV
jgi:hypothetical protein